jgi:hypothetical protein
MELTFEVTLDYGEDGPDEGEPTPDAHDLTGFIMALWPSRWGKRAKVVVKQL